MINDKKILGLIPARGGSKGLPGKNIKPMNSKPLIAWTIEQALQSRYLDRIFVSTDSGEIAKIAQKHGAVVPFLRPQELAADDSPISEAIIHALETFESGNESYDYVALLEPTSPLRKPNDIDDALLLLTQHDDEAECVVSVGEVHMEHPMIIKKISDQGYVVPYIANIAKIYQRQQTDEAYFPYGVIYISKVPEFKKNRTFYTDKTLPYFVERWQNYEVDDELDFDIIAQIMRMKMEDMNG